MESDKFSVRAVVVVLGAVVLVVVLGEVWLASTGTSIPDSLDRLGFAALGAVGAMLAKTSTGPADVVVQNEPGQPVPVDDNPDERPLHAD